MAAKYAVVHLAFNNVVGVYLADTKRDARRCQREIERREGYSNREPETAWIWNVETNEQDP